MYFSGTYWVFAQHYSLRFIHVNAHSSCSLVFTAVEYCIM